jgi:NAD(P)-dependent dehydrogenase (short-subunit alcohol dehydrogenase family)
MEKFVKRITQPPKNTFLRIFKAIWRQKAKTPICPDKPRLDGKLVLITGGNNGIGLETSKGLVERGADLIILARNESKSRLVIEKIRKGDSSKITFFRMDLADIDSITKAIKEIASTFSDRKINMIVANAGITPNGYSTSAQDYEKVFAVNVLGHHILFKACLERSLLEDNAHIISVAGDIYIASKKSSPDYYTKKESVTNAYNQSKLGVMWWAYEVRRRYRHLSVNIVHPGVVATGLGGEEHGLIRRFLRKNLMITPEEGAQTTLFCATQPDIINGGYYHNTMGQVILHQDDPAIDSEKSEEFWNLLEDISSVFLNKNE